MPVGHRIPHTNERQALVQKTHMCCVRTFMITYRDHKYNTETAEGYDKSVTGISVYKLTCSGCGHKGNMIRYGHYTRHTYYDCRVEELRIQRVRCKFCGKTHSLLPDTLVPRDLIVLQDQLQVILNYESGNDWRKTCFENPLVDEQAIRHIIKRYLRHWKERCISEDISLYGDLVRSCFDRFGRQFMQIRRERICFYESPT